MAERRDRARDRYSRVRNVSRIKNRARDHLLGLPCRLRRGTGPDLAAKVTELVTK